MNKIIRKLGICMGIMAAIVAIVGLVLGIMHSQNIAALGINRPNVYIVCMELLGIITAICGLIYFLKGASKKVALLYKISFFTFLLMIAGNILYTVTISARIGTIDTQSVAGYIFSITLLLVVFSCILLLTCAPNLGKKRSIILATISIIAVIAPTIIGLTVIGTFNGFLVNMVLKIELIVMLHMMVYAKYDDKDARGTI